MPMLRLLTTVPCATGAGGLPPQPLPQRGLRLGYVATCLRADLEGHEVHHGRERQH